MILLNIDVLATLSTILACVVAIITFTVAYNQLKVMNKQFQTEISHRTTELARKQCELFVNTVLPYYQNYKVYLYQNDLIVNHLKIDSYEITKLGDSELTKYKDVEVYPFLNSLDLVAISINNGSADKIICQQTFGIFYCEAIETFTPIISHIHSNYPDGYKNAIKLYKEWRSDYSSIINTSPKLH